MNLTNKILEKLSEYIGFDISEILENENIDIAYVFGGAIRDIIAEKEIHDIDILSLSNSVKNISKILKKHGYLYQNDLKLIDLENLYKDINIISVPLNFLKIVDNKIKLVQIIKPKGLTRNIIEIKKTLEGILHNIDLSNCGLYFYHSKNYELVSINDAYYHCIFNTYQVYNKTSMYEVLRTNKRMYKLEQRGWKLHNEDIEKDIIRYKKLDRINGTQMHFKYLNIQIDKGLNDLPF